MDEVLYERKGAGAWRCLNRPEEASPRGRGPTPPCGAGRVVCLIDPVGDVYACPFAIHDRFLAGNVLSGRGFDGTVTLSSSRQLGESVSEQCYAVLQGPPVVRHERGMEVWM